MADRPVTQLDKTEVLSGLFAVWDAIDALLQDAPEAQWKAMTPLPGWNVQAVISHIIGTESFLEGVAAPEPAAVALFGFERHQSSRSLRGRPNESGSRIGQDVFGRALVLEWPRPFGALCHGLLLLARKSG